MKSVRLLLLFSLGGLAMVGCGRGNDTGFSEGSTVVSGVDFLVFPNPQAHLGVGDYSVVITNNILSAFTYTLTVTQTDGSSQTSSGTLAGLASTTVTFAQKIAGGVTISLNSAGANATIELRNSGSASSSIYDLASATGANPGITLSAHHIDQTAYADAYYQAVDPLNERDTLAKFKTKNGYGSSCSPNGTTEFEARFRDVRDLGYGRHLCVRGDTTAAGDVVAWVENFQVSAIPGQHYERLNLEAVINDDRRWHIGTNAIEYSAGPNGGARYLKFYTFNPDGTRRTVVDLDGRGAKAMPVPCISCHGGRAPPLLATATAVLGGGGVTSRFQPAVTTMLRGDTIARMQPINVDTLEFWGNPPYRRSDLEASLKAMNQLVLCSYPLVGGVVGAEDNCRTAVASNEWQGTNAAMIKAWYGGTGMASATASDTFVPTAWTDAGAGVAGAQNLYQTVVAPYCRVCHSLRGNANQSDQDFTTYAKFTGYADRILYHVYDKGNMPLALLKFNQFWESNAPATLAPFVPGSTSGGSVLSPTRPVAKAGPDRVVRPGSATLSAAESTNVATYSWSVVSGPCTMATSQTGLVRPTITAVLGPPECTFQLIVNNGATNSAAVQVKVYVSNTAPSGVRFTDIRSNILQGVPGCDGCHTPAGGYPQIPLYYAASVDYDGDGTGTADAEDLHQLYLNVRARVNLTNVEGSFLLLKPTGNHHCGGQVLNITGLPPGDATAARVFYDTILNWILDGAPE